MANEKWLIDASKFRERLYERPLDFVDIGGDFGYFDETIESVLNEQPTVDAVEVVHGHNTYDHDSAFECSVCGWSDWDTMTGDGKYNYCPNCGAKMDGDGNG